MILILANMFILAINMVLLLQKTEDQFLIRIFLFLTIKLLLLIVLFMVLCLRSLKLLLQIFVKILILVLLFLFSSINTAEFNKLFLAKLHQLYLYCCRIDLLYPAAPRG